MTPTLATLRDLQSRVREATGPDFSLDRDIGLALWGWRLDKPHRVGLPGMLHTLEGSTIDDEGAIIPSPTESIDTAIELVEHVTPREVSDHVGAAYRNLSERFIWHIRRSEPGQFTHLPRAILASMLTSLIEKAERPADEQTGKVW